MSKKELIDITPSEVVEAFVDTKDAFMSSNLFNDFYILNNIIINSESSDFFCKGYSKKFSGYAYFREKLIKYADKSKTKRKSESSTINTRIQAVLDMLGWYDQCEDRGEHPYSEGATFSVDGISYELDLALCRSAHDAEIIDEVCGEKKGASTKKREEKNEELINLLRKNVVTILEAKEFSKLKNKKKVQKKKSSKVRDTASAQGPEGQILEYLQASGVTQGILTDGSKWKLFHKDLSDSEIIRSFNFDFDNLLRDARRINLGEGNLFPNHFEVASRIFYFFFSKESHNFKRDRSEQSIVQTVSGKCLNYANELEGVLKDRFMETMNSTCNSFFINSDIKTELKDKNGRKFLRNCSESFLFNLIFVKSCEMNAVLPIEQPEYRTVMIQGIVNKLWPMNPSYFEEGKDRELESRCKEVFGNTYKSDGTDIYKKILKNFKEIYDGNTTLRIDGFKEDVFDKKEWKFINSSFIKNNEMVRILYKLSYLYSKGNNQQIPYNYLRPRQFGEVYESFMEFKLEFADVNYYFHKKKQQLVELKSYESKKHKDEVFRVKKGLLFFSPNNEDRKFTGSYYTPHYVVKDIVKKTLESKLNTIVDPSEILKLSVCDPAMGSGHFLNYSLRYLTKTYRLKYYSETGVPLDEGFNVTARRVLDKCIFGVDINTSAVKLTKLSLWLSTAYRGEKLEKLDDQIKAGDSLIDFNWKKEFKKVFAHGGFDAIVGNPPYVRREYLKEKSTELEKKFVSFNSDADLCVYFIEKGFELLNSSGKLSYVITNKWMRSKYGQALRHYLSSKTSVEEIVDFKDLPVFEGISAYPMILRLGKSWNKQFKHADVESLNFDDLTKHLETIFTLRNNSDLSDATWTFGNKEETQILDAMQEVEYTLADVINGKILSGLKTALNPAFVISKEQAQSFYSNDKSYKELIHPFLTGREVKRYTDVEASKYVICIPKGWTNANLKGSNKWSSFKKKYPLLASHLEPFEEKGKKRSDKGDYWWELRACDYYDKLQEEKIVFPDISQDGNFIIESGGQYVDMTAFVIPSSSKFLLGFLNSSPVQKYISKNSPEIRGGYYRWKKQYVSSIPFPFASLQDVPKKIKSDVEKNVDTILKSKPNSKKYEEASKKVDQLIMTLYASDNVELKEAA